MDATDDLYEILQVHPSAHQDVIDAAYRRLALIHHPDRTKSPEAPDMMSRLNYAYEILSDPGKRAAYDSQRVVPGSLARRSGEERRVDVHDKGVEAALEQVDRRRREMEARQPRGPFGIRRLAFGAVFLVAAITIAISVVVSAGNGDAEVKQESDVDVVEGVDHDEAACLNHQKLLFRLDAGVRLTDDRVTAWLEDVREEALLGSSSVETEANLLLIAWKQDLDKESLPEAGAALNKVCKGLGHGASR